MDVSIWLRDLGMDDYVQAFQAHDIDAEVLPRLTAHDLTALGVTSIGHRRRLLDAIAALEKGRPPAAAAAMAGSLRPIEAERRQLTVLFCDLVGSTELSARLDPEDLREVLRGYQAACADVIGRFDGHVARFLGDGILAYFGWPRAHEDDAERAVHAGLQLVDDIARLEPRPGVWLQARVGVATGQVVVGDLISPGVSDKDAVIGDTPNLAARLQALATPGTVIISAATRRLVGGVFELADLGPQRLKGFAEPLSAFQVEGQGRAEGRFEARQNAGLTPLVGREEELALLLRRWGQAKGGAGQVVLLSGKPGIGKSRLVRELRQRISAEPHVRLTHQCSPYHQTSPLHPIIEHLERAAGFARDDAPAARLDKLDTLLARSTERLGEAVPLIAALLGIPSGERYPALELTPQRQKQLTLEVLLEQLAALAAEQPVLVVHEDVHWIDPTTQELLSLTAERIAHLPVLMIITFRLEFTSPWAGPPHVSALALTRLPPRESSSMVEHVVGAKALPDEVAAQIVAKTDGVPLFVEELTKAVLESGLLAEAGDRFELPGPLPPLVIPATLRDSLLARLDHVAPAKEVAQIGAAIGREFSHALVVAVADRPEPELRAALDQLVRSGIIFRRAAPPEATYSFKHGLVQDAAYDTLLNSRRPQLHARIAEVLEDRFRDTTEPELLAQHCILAGLTEKAVDHLLAAGRRAFAGLALLGAVDHLKKALKLLEDLPQGLERERRELEVTMILAWALITTKGSAATETMDTIMRATKLCREGGEEAHILLFWQFLCRLVRGELGLARQWAENLLRGAQQQENTTPLLIGHRAVGTSSLFLGIPGMGRDDLERAIALYGAEPQHSVAAFYVVDPWVVAVSYLALAEFVLGYPMRAAMRVSDALTGARRLSHPLSLAHALYFACPLYQLSRNYPALEDSVRKLTLLCDSGHHQVYAAGAAVLRGWAQGDLEQVEKGLAHWRSTEAKLLLPYWLALSAEAYCRGGRADEALSMLAEASTSITQTGERWYDAELRRRRADLIAAKHPDWAEAGYRRAVEIARAQQAKLWELCAATSLARLWRDQGRRAEAHDLLAPVYGWFTEGFDTADLKDAKALLEELA